MKITAKHEQYMLSMLEKILNIPSPSGYTGEIVSFMQKETANMGYHTEIDRKGGLIVKASAKAKPVLCISSHLDTLGGMVKKIKGNGRVVFERVGGYAYSTVLGNTCKILASNGRTYCGTIVPAKISGHIYSHTEIDGMDKSRDNIEIRLDEKVNTAKDVEKLGIDTGDWVFIDPNVRITESGFINSRHLDDKASAALVLTVMKMFSEKKIPQQVMFHFSVYEETGAGTFILPDSVHEFLCVDMAVTGDNQNSDEFSVTICLKDSSMPYNREFSEKLIKTAQKHKIPFKKDLYPYYGSDAGGFIRAGYDIKAALIGMGVEASHAYERTHKEGLINTAKLLLAYIGDLK